MQHPPYIHTISLCLIEMSRRKHHHELELYSKSALEANHGINHIPISHEWQKAKQIVAMPAYIPDCTRIRNVAYDEITKVKEFRS